MVQIVDGVLQLLEHRLLAGPFLGDIGDDPRGKRAPARTDRRQRARLDAVPVRPGEIAAADRCGEANLLVGADPLAEPLRNPVDRFRRFDVARESPLDRTKIRRIGRPGEIGVDAVGVDDAGVAIGDQHALAGGIKQHLAEFVALAAHAETDDAQRPGERRHHPHHRHHGEQANHKGLRFVRLEQRKAEGNADQPTGDEDQAAQAGDPPRAIGDRSYREQGARTIAHPRRILSLDARHGLVGNHAGEDGR